MSFAKLRPEFIEQHPPKKDFFEAHRASYAWSARTVPIYQWEELLFVGTPQPESFSEMGGTEIPKHWVLIEVDASTLATIWEVYSQEAVVDQPVAAIPKIAKIESFNFDGGFPDAVTTSGLELPPLPGEELDLGSDSETLPEIPVAAEELLEFPNLDLPNLDFASLQSAPVVSLNVSASAAAPVPPPPPTRDDFLDELTPPPAVNAANRIDDDLTPANLEARIERTPTKKDEVPNEERLILNALPAMFKKTLLAFKSGNSLQIVSWPSSQKVSESTEHSFSLNTPSPFRVALRTEKSYHGYTVQNAFLNEFFKFWNEGQYPDSLTVVPVTPKKNIEGFIISFGTTEAQQRVCLAHVEKLTQEIEDRWPAIVKNLSSQKSA